MKIKIKNYCICKRKNNIIYREQDCPARFHIAKKGTVEYDPQDILVKCTGNLELQYGLQVIKDL